MTDLFERAEQARAKSNFTLARKTYQTLLRSKLPREEKAEALLGLADVERIGGYFPEALRHYKEAEKLFKGIDETAVLDAQTGWALSARASGNPGEALKVLSKTLSQYKELKDKEGEAFTHWALGGTLRIAGAMNKSLKHLLVAFSQFKKLKNEEGLAYTCCALGGIYRMLGQYALSGKYYLEANQRMRQRKDTFGIAYSYCGLGNVQRMAGRFNQALPFYKKAEKLYGTIGDRVSYAYTLWSIGTTYKMLKKGEKAAQYFFEANKLFIETGDTRGRIYVQQGLHESLSFSSSGKKIKQIFRFFEKNSISSDNFYWENLHEYFLSGYTLVQGKIVVAESKLHFLGGDNFKNDLIMAKKEKTLFLKKVKKIYLATGSRFYPKSIPVNWP